ncbi:dihydroorotase [Spirochaetota bacterium]|nr:dihydroorotase [Spirochaetota bacterium]
MKSHFSKSVSSKKASPVQSTQPTYQSQASSKDANSALKSSLKSWKIRFPDDFHVHLRSAELLPYTTPFTAQSFRRAIIMPNLSPPISTVAAALTYRNQILSALTEASLSHTPYRYNNNDDDDNKAYYSDKVGHRNRISTKKLPYPFNKFTPLMTLYLQETTAKKDLVALARSSEIIGCKYYPKGVTTHANYGIKSLATISPVLEIMEELKIPLMIHGESPEKDIDVFDREAHFIEHVLTPIIDRFPTLKITLEHITSRHAVAFIRDAPAHVCATITLHHLLLTRNDLLASTLKPHFYCKPIMKREADRKALLNAALGRYDAPYNAPYDAPTSNATSPSQQNTSKNTPPPPISPQKSMPPAPAYKKGKFFFGSDSAPHQKSLKEAACGCAGVFSAPFCIEMLAQIFAEQNAKEHLEAFVSVNGAAHYNLPLNTDTLELIPTTNNDIENTIPNAYHFGAHKTFIPFRPFPQLKWKQNSQIFENSQGP